MTEFSAQERLTFNISIALKKSKRIKRERDEDPFPGIARHISDQLRLSGWRFEHDATKAVLEPGGVTLDAYRAVTADARAALRMIREVLEAHAPPGTIPPEEDVEPPFTAEAEVLVKAILATLKSS